MSYLEIEQAFRSATGEEALLLQEHRRRAERKLGNRPRIVLSINPIPSRQQRLNIADGRAMQNARDTGVWPAAGALEAGYCYEGIELRSRHDPMEIRLLRNGGMAASFQADGEDRLDTAGMLLLRHVTRYLIALLAGYGRFLVREKIEAPLHAVASVVNGHSKKFYRSEADSFQFQGWIDTEILDFQPLLLTSVPADPHAACLALRPWLHQWWQAAGSQRSPLFEQSTETIVEKKFIQVTG